MLAGDTFSQFSPQNSHEWFGPPALPMAERGAGGQGAPRMRSNGAGPVRAECPEGDGRVVGAESEGLGVNNACWCQQCFAMFEFFISDEEWLGELGLFRGQTTKGGPHQFPRVSEGGCLEFGSRLCLVVPSNRVRGNRQKLMHEKFHLNIKTNLFTVRVTTRWNRLSREAVGPPLLEIFKNHLDTIECRVH